MTKKDEPSAPEDEDATTRASRVDDDDAEDRAAILKRRAMFVASAIAGLGMASCSGDPRPCLDVAIPPDPDAGLDAGEPQPCLSVAPPVDAGAGAGGSAATGDPSSDAGAPPPDGGETRPRACLKVAPPRPCLSPPRPCLDMPPPGDPSGNDPP